MQFCLHPQIIQKLGRRLDAGDQKVISRTGAGDVEEVAFGVVRVCASPLVGIFFIWRIRTSLHDGKFEAEALEFLVSSRGTCLDCAISMRHGQEDGLERQVT